MPSWRVWSNFIIYRIDGSLNSRSRLVSNSHRLSPCALSSTLALIRPLTLIALYRLITLMGSISNLLCSQRLSCTLKKFELSSTLALIRPLTLIALYRLITLMGSISNLLCSQRLSCTLNKFELLSTLALVSPLTLMCSVDSRMLSSTLMRSHRV